VGKAQPSANISLAVLPGDYVTPSIRLVRLLGRGGMGAVWLAEHEKLRSEVVVKFIVGSEALLPEARARFEREATLAAQAKSPHVVQVFDHGVSEQGVPYIAMERLSGEDLASRLERERRITPTVFVEWFRQISVGIGRAHARGIVHRDLKPENLFLCNEDGEVLVKILDFGIAKGADVPSGFNATMTGAMLGTVHFMSPEQAMGDGVVDARTDLWALGVLTYYSLTGTLPFQGDALGAIVVQITATEPRPPSEIVPLLPRAVDAWMKKALAKKPEERFQDAREMAMALQESVLGYAASRPYDFGDADSRPPVLARPRNVTTLTPAAGHGPFEVGLGRSRWLPVLGFTGVVLVSATAFLGADFYRSMSGAGARAAAARSEPLSPVLIEPGTTAEATLPDVASPEELEPAAESPEKAAFAAGPAKNGSTKKANRTSANKDPAATRGEVRAQPRKSAGAKRGLEMKLE
jgi:eukaryotic-like serine/threonine-protein kinase